MASESTNRKTTSLPRPSVPGGDKPVWLIDDRAKTSIRELQESELLQLSIDYPEEEIQFASSKKQVQPDSLAEYFASPAPQIVSFYRYPGIDAVILIWTGHDWTKSTKHTKMQNRLRRDLSLIAEGEGIKIAHMMKVGSQNEIGGDRLREIVLSTPTPAVLSREI